MDLVSRHGKGESHRSWTGVLPTNDPWTFYIPAGHPVTEADGSAWSSPYDVVAMFWPRRFYQVILLLKTSATEYYCNVISPVQYDVKQQQLVFNDLELDVVVSDSGAELRDVDEFEIAKVNYGDEWIEGAMNAQEELLRLATEHSGPFSSEVANYWRNWAESGHHNLDRDSSQGE